MVSWPSSITSSKVSYVFRFSISLFLASTISCFPSSYNSTKIYTPIDVINKKRDCTSLKTSTTDEVISTIPSFYIGVGGTDRKLNHSTSELLKVFAFNKYVIEL